MSKSLTVHSNQGTNTAAASEFVPVIGYANSPYEAFQGRTQAPIGVAGNFTQLYLRAGMAAGESYDLRVNGVDTALDHIGVASDPEKITGTVAVVAGDLIGGFVGTGGSISMEETLFVFEATSGTAWLEGSFNRTGETISGGSVEYFSTGHLSQADSDINRREIRQRSTGAIHRVFVFVEANASSANGSLTAMINESASGQEATITSASTGLFSDTGASASYSAGDDIVFRITGGTGGTTRYNIAGCTFVSSDDKCDVWCVPDGSRSDQNNTYYLEPWGDTSLGTTSTTTNQKEVPYAATVSDYRANFGGNTLDNNVTITLQKNGVDTDLEVTVTGGSTGWFEDTSSTEDLAVDDTLQSKFVMTTGGTSAGDIKIGFCLAEIVSEDITGVGAADISPFSADALGSLNFVGVGVVDISPVDADAAGLLNFIGVGDADISSVDAAAVGVLDFTGIGAADISPVDAAAVGIFGFIGFGAADISPIDAAATGILNFIGIGAAGISPVDAAAIGELEFIGIGAADISPVDAAAVGTTGIAGIGAADISPVDVAAVGLLNFIAVGAADISPVDVAAAGTLNFIAVGAADISPADAAAVGFTGILALGAADISSVDADAVGVLNFIAIGDAFISPVDAAAAGTTGFTGVGDAFISPVSANAVGEIGIIGIGNAIISAFFANAIGAVPVPTPGPVIGSAKVKSPPAPLKFDEPITNKDGTPTDYFLRQWALQVRTNTSLEQVIADIISLNSAVVALRAIELVAGVALSGGGFLDFPTITFNLEDTAVTPDTYGDANNVAQLTIDQQGRITAAAEVAIAGGGGGGAANFSWPAEVDDVATATAGAYKGFVFRPLVDTQIFGVAALLDTLAGATYRAAVYRIDGSDEIDELTGVSADTASPGALTMTNIFIPIAAEPTLTAGLTYIVVIGRTDGGDAYLFPISVETAQGQTIWWPGLPLELYIDGAGFPQNRATIAVANPIIGTAVTLSGNASMWGIGIKFSL